MTDTDRWSAFIGRDAAFDGAFVAAVTSTGIYCRPSCPARRPKPENVRFYDLPERAEHEGFCACKRCHPRDADAPDPHIEALRRVCRFIEDHDDGPPTLAAMGAEVDLSPHHLQRSFKQVVGVTPRSTTTPAASPGSRVACGTATRSPGRSTKPATAHRADCMRRRRNGSA